MSSVYCACMEYESEKERLSTNACTQTKGTKISKEKKAEVVELYKLGKTNEQVAEESGISKPTAIAIKKDAIANNFSIGDWKRQTSTLMAQIVSKGSNRLLEEIENIPAGQLPVALAILVDKVLVLQDAPTTVVEHRLRITHEDINKMIKGEVIDILPQKSVDAITEVDK
jgi:hypothetical protein